MEKLKSLGMKIGAKVDALRATGGLLIIVDGYDLWKAK
jgi:hypothetical protein